MMGNGFGNKPVHGGERGALNDSAGSLDLIPGALGTTDKFETDKFRLTFYTGYSRSDVKEGFGGTSI